jgi:hypothetical protein
VSGATVARMDCVRETRWVNGYDMGALIGHRFGGGVL